MTEYEIDEYLIGWPLHSFSKLLQDALGLDVPDGDPLYSEDGTNTMFSKELLRFFKDFIQISVFIVSERAGLSCDEHIFIGVNVGAESFNSSIFGNIHTFLLEMSKIGIELGPAQILGFSKENISYNFVYGEDWIN